MKPATANRCDTTHAADAIAAEPRGVDSSAYGRTVG